MIHGVLEGEREMTLDELKKRVDFAHKYAGETAKTCKVTIIVGKKEFEIESINQFGVVADVVICVGKRLR